MSSTSHAFGPKPPNDSSLRGSDIVPRSYRRASHYRRGSMPAQFIYQMRDLRRFYPPDREVLKGINLSFYPGAKIGVIGANGSGKSSLLRLLASRPDLLLLDEPTSHLDAESVAWLERLLHEYEGTVVAVTHGRYFLDNAAGWILELDRGAGLPWEGNYSSWLEQKEARLAHEEKADSARRRTLERELEWVRLSPRARQAKGKARLSAYEALLAEAAAAPTR